MRTGWINASTRVVFFAEDNGTLPIVDWLDALISKAQVKCLAKLKRLEELGHELRRPEADLLKDGIYELRIGLQGVNYRILYFFTERRRWSSRTESPKSGRFRPRKSIWQLIGRNDSRQAPRNIDSSRRSEYGEKEPF